MVIPETEEAGISAFAIVPFVAIAVHQYSAGGRRYRYLTAGILCRPDSNDGAVRKVSDLFADRLIFALGFNVFRSRTDRDMNQSNGIVPTSGIVEIAAVERKDAALLIRYGIDRAAPELVATGVPAHETDIHLKAVGAQSEGIANVLPGGKLCLPECINKITERLYIELVGKLRTGNCNAELRLAAVVGYNVLRLVAPVIL